jgi:hypothetical protein
MKEFLALASYFLSILIIVGLLLYLSRDERP